ncbi:MAG: hypothetical protein LR015_13135 [Verrucomicrobia bacterium]|nr:hypothetical protein [Verrucomicrobiota bacterium]
MANYPETDVIELQAGASRCILADPRSSGTKLGARYVHGGYILDLWHQDSPLTSSAVDAWDPYVGRGLPEVFETGLGFDRCTPGQSYLRIGAGVVCRESDGSWNDSGMTLLRPVQWTMEHLSQSRLVCSCTDNIEIAGQSYAYTLTRTVQLEANRLVSHSHLKCHFAWSEPLLWFGHPFFAQSPTAQVAIDLPVGLPQSTGLNPIASATQPAPNGAWHTFPAQGGFCWLPGFWGHRKPLHLLLPKSGLLALSLSVPMEKAVCFATPAAFSIEPYWSRGWMGGETGDWQLEYSFGQ